MDIPYGKHNITDEDIQAVTAVLKSNNLTQGPKIPAFEEAFAKYVGARYAVAVSNGTSALHLCTLAMNVRPGQKVITTPITFAASANCVRYRGGDVVFSDIDPDTLILDIAKVRTLLGSAPRGTYKGIIPVDFAGKASNLEAFRELADEYGLWIIEDACHAPGAYFTDSKGQKQHCGNGNFADLAVFSFHPVKHIATGEGGMITTNDEALYKRLLKLRTHGITSDRALFKNSPDFAGAGESGENYPGWYMEMQELGFNYRVTDIQAALGLSQLNRAAASLERRRALARRYDAAFAGNKAGITVHQQESAACGEHDAASGEAGHAGEPGQADEPSHAGSSAHAYHLYVIGARNRLALYNYLRQQRILVQVHYIPLHLMPYYRELGWKEGDFPAAENYYKTCLSLPLYPSLTNEQQDLVIETILSFQQRQLNANR